jgi:hypothetical protein
MRMILLYYKLYSHIIKLYFATLYVELEILETIKILNEHSNNDNFHSG